jgi:hypothetical protein
MFLSESYRKRIVKLAGIVSESIILESSMSDKEKFKKYFKGIDVKDFKNLTYPKDDSAEAKKELLKIKSIELDRDFVKRCDDIKKVFKDYFRENDLDFPEKLVSDIIDGVSYLLIGVKNHYDRLRPNKLAKKLGMDLDFVNLSSARTPAFPSGHTTQSHLLAYILSDMFPKHKKSFKKIADDISMSRMMAKVHFPSDIESGEKVAKELYKQYKENNML